MKNPKVPEDHILSSFEVESLFINVPLDKAIDFIVKRIYTDRKVEKSISRADM